MGFPKFHYKYTRAFSAVIFGVCNWVMKTTCFPGSTVPYRLFRKPQRHAILWRNKRSIMGSRSSRVACGPKVHVSRSGVGGGWWPLGTKIFYFMGRSTCSPAVGEARREVWLSHRQHKPLSSKALVKSVARLGVITRWKPMKSQSTAFF